MIIEIEIDDIELFAKALNNATIAYWDICSSIFLGCDPQINSMKFLPLSELSDGELENRFNILRDVCEQVEEKEKKLTTQWKELCRNDQRRENHEPST